MTTIFIFECKDIIILSIHIKFQQNFKFIDYKIIQTKNLVYLNQLLIKEPD